MLMREYRLQGKTVQVVSNNNSAIDNIFEKLALPEYQMQFIAARLGSTERKNIFIESLLWNGISSLFIILFHLYIFIIFNISFTC